MNFILLQLTFVPLWAWSALLLAPSSVNFHFASFHLFEADLKINHSQDNRWLINTTRCTLTLLLVITRNGQNFLRLRCNTRERNRSKNSGSEGTVVMLTWAIIHAPTRTVLFYNRHSHGQAVKVVRDILITLLRIYQAAC